jgi:predicted metal-dependent enzyme (double-stranded beta helix superfamily)
VSQSRDKEAAVAANVYTIDRFVEDAKAVVARGHSAADTVQALTPLLQRLVSRPDCLADRGGSPDPERGFEAYASPTLTVQAIIWQAGSKAPPHNHNGWAMVGVVKGHERNVHYRRLDDGSTPWRVKLEPAGVYDILPGQTGAVIAPDDIHAVEIPSGKTLAIHVFGTDISKQWRLTFDVQTGEAKPFVFRRM